MYLGCASDTHNFVIRQKRLSEPLHTMAPSPPLWTITHQGSISSSEPHSQCSPSVSLSLGSISFHLTHTWPYVLLWLLYSTQCGVVECHASHNIGFFWKLISVYASLDCVGCDADGRGAVLKTFIFSQAVCLHLWCFKEHFVHHAPFSEACYRLTLSYLIIPFPLE